MLTRAQQTYTILSNVVFDSSGDVRKSMGYVVLRSELFSDIPDYSLNMDTYVGYLFCLLDLDT